MNLIQSNIKTMSSREIAILVESRHDSVKRTVSRLIESNIIQPTPLVGVKNEQGQTVSEYQISKRDSYIVVAQLSPQFTARLVDRWQELEQANQPAVPQTYAAALLEAGRLAQALEETSAKLIEAQPKVEYHDNVLDSTNGITTSEIASELGMSAQKLNKILAKKMVQKKVGGRWLLRAKHLNQGYDTEATYLDDGGNSRHAMKWTEKGRKFIHGLIEGVK